MAVYSCCGIICRLLAQAYPNGLTIEELIEQGSKEHTLMKSRNWVGSMLGIHDNVRDPERGDIKCWIMQNGKINFDPSRKKYIDSPGYQLEFALMFNSWLEENGLRHLISFRPLTIENSLTCPQKILWKEIPGVNILKNCTYDYQEHRCFCTCGLDPSNKFDAWAKGAKRPF